MKPSPNPPGSVRPENSGPAHAPRNHGSVNDRHAFRRTPDALLKDPDRTRLTGRYRLEDDLKTTCVPASCSDTQPDSCLISPEQVVYPAGWSSFDIPVTSVSSFQRESRSRDLKSRRLSSTCSSDPDPYEHARAHAVAVAAEQTSLGLLRTRHPGRPAGTCP